MSDKPHFHIDVAPHALAKCLKALCETSGVQNLCVSEQDGSLTVSFQYDPYEPKDGGRKTAPYFDFSKFQQ